MTTNRYKAPPRLYNCTLYHHQSTKYARNMKKYHKHISTKIHSSSPHILSIMGSKTCTSFQQSAKVASDKWFQTEKDINQQRHCIVKILLTIYMDICQTAMLFHPQQILNSNITWQLAIFLSFQSSVLVTEKGCLLCHFDHSQPHCFPPSLLLLIFARSQRAMWMFSSFMSRESQIWNVVIAIFQNIF